MNGEDFTQTLLDRTDALIAKHRQPKGAISPTPEGVIETAPMVPVLTQKLSPEEAALLIQSAALVAEKDNADMQSIIDSAASADLLCLSDADAIAEAATLQIEDTAPLAESLDHLSSMPLASSDADVVDHKDAVATDDTLLSGMPAVMVDHTAGDTQRLVEHLSDVAPTDSTPVLMSEAENSVIAGPFNDSPHVANTFDDLQASEETLGVGMPFVSSADNASNNVNQPTHHATQKSDIDTGAWSEKLSAELAPLICDLAKEVSATIISQMMPDLQKTIEGRLHQVFSELVSEAKREKTDI